MGIKKVIGVALGVGIVGFTGKKILNKMNSAFNKSDLISACDRCCNNLNRLKKKRNAVALRLSKIKANDFKNEMLEVIKKIEQELKDIDQEINAWKEAFEKYKIELLEKYNYKYNTIG